ncbi:MAG: rhomboid family intramembrane serine protease [Schleiferiaceae bacterium]|nr:rhomboid family intramembrane serine protease [Schleiferiaceae bacterium]
MQYSAPNRFSFLPPVIKNLLIINGLFFVASISLVSTFGINLPSTLGLYTPGSPDFMPHQIITHMFLHSLESPAHIFFNMFALWMFGVGLENRWGSQRFLLFYVLTGLGAAACHVGVNLYEAYELKKMITAAGYSNAELTEILKMDFRTGVRSTAGPLRDYFLLYKTPTIGASGAVYGILMGFGMTFPNQRIYIYLLIPIKAKYFVALFGILELYATLGRSTSNIAHFAHLGGMLFGFILIRYWRRKYLI